MGNDGDVLFELNIDIAPFPFASPHLSAAFLHSAKSLLGGLSLIVSCYLGIFSCIGESFEFRRRHRGRNMSVELTTIPLPASLLQSSTPSPRSSVRPLRCLSSRCTADSFPLPSYSLPLHREGQSRLSVEPSLVKERLILIAFLLKGKRCRMIFFSTSQ